MSVLPADLDLDLDLLGETPLNGETRLDAQMGPITPAGRHYVRTNFGVPSHPGTLDVGGLVHHARTFTIDELRSRSSVTSLVTLECAGNGRRYLEPAVPGEPWRLGAVGTAEWTGTRLTDVLDEVGVEAGAVEVVFRGADEGVRSGIDGPVAFERSMPIADAPGAILAWEMNGEPLPAQHGAPIRLLVPGRYGMASVKWVTRVNVVGQPFHGHFQTDRYVIDGAPLGPIAPRALITSLKSGDQVTAGTPIVVRGYGWSGAGPVVQVEISSDGGSSWADAVLGPSTSRFAWRTFELQLPARPEGSVELLARATDSDGAQQPLTQNWNSLGYMNNAVQQVLITIAPPQ